MGPNKEVDVAASAKIGKALNKEFHEAFARIECFKDTFSLQIKEKEKPCQAPPICIAYLLQNHLRIELEYLWEQQTIAALLSR